MDPILFVAPSQAIADAASLVAKEMGVSLYIEISTMDEAKNIALNYPEIGIYISRGGIAQALKELPGKTVVEISAAVSDYLEPVHRIAANGINKVGVVANHSVLEDNEQDLRVGNIEIFIRPWKNAEQLRQLMGQLSQTGVAGIVGDNTGAKIAKEYGLIVEAFESGAASIKRSINEAVKLARAQEVERVRERNKTQQIHKNVTEIYTALERAVAAIQELTASSEELAARSQETASISKNAAKEVEKTSEILGIIRRVAQQTNLLGLNAAIEAARAGDHGRGFAVVAEEVRKLADESNKSAGVINQMLNNFRDSVEQVQSNVEQSNVITQEQAKATQEIAEMLDGLRRVGENLLALAASTKN
ncbi:propionate catabolism activator [Anaerospora hongkongensis]|uniref:Propionate catabolism activator n=1 Tax=Anaerospora hongkongensis TaxID=244830 RepID=A0A4V2Q8X3_9FIRM|nr:methyl-accepting chemotaxis protein [Anaerospora hongkongensis]TCL38829.1 propionate catabolism activator [Anaerospora hongkongensis]